MSQKVYVSRIPSDYSSACAAVSDILNRLQLSYGHLDETTLFELKVILNELVLNAIKHGNKGQGCKSVNIEAGLTENGYAFFNIADEGEGYDYMQLMQNCSCIPEYDDECELKTTGRGLLIVLNLCDRIRFNKKGNRIVVLKKLFK